MRCFGSKRYALRCNNSARPGFATCGVHQKQELVVTHHFADEIADELAAYRPTDRGLGER